MSANGIANLVSKQLKQERKLAIAEAKRKGKELKKEFPDIVGSCIGKISFIF